MRNETSLDQRVGNVNIFRRIVRLRDELSQDGFFL
jgi:hypothetical protein